MQTRVIVFFALLAAILACGPSESVCGGTLCYDASTTVCAVDSFTSKYQLCPNGAPSSCNGACFASSAYHCVSGQLVSGPATTVNNNVQSKASTSSSIKASTSSIKASTTKAPTSSTTSINKASTSSTTSSTKAPTTSSTTSSTKAPTTSSTTSSTYSTASPASTSSAAASTAAAACNTAGCGVGTCNCNGACFAPSQYNCATDVYTGKLQLCQSNYSSCNTNCFDSAKATCSSSGSIVPNGASGGGNTPASSTYPPPVVPPAPAPQNRPTQTADLRIVNSCKTTLWVEGRYGGQGAPIPGQSQTSLPVGPGGYVDYTVPDSGLGGTRFWAKYGCDAYGKNCLIGDAMQYWPNPPGG